MAKFYGAIGYIDEIETSPDVITPMPIERMYKGELVKNGHRYSNGIDVADDISLSNSISILADPYAMNHMHTIRYVKWRGTAWKVTSIESEPPRLILSLGGVYNGPVKN